MFGFKSLFFTQKKLFSCLLILTLSPIFLPFFKVNAQTSTTQENVNNNENQDLTIVRPLEKDELFSMVGAQRLQTEGMAAISAQNYQLGIEKLQESRQVFNQLSNFHLQLANQFQGFNNNIYNARRRSALEAGQKRDEVTLLLANAHQQAGEAPLAIPLLIQVIESQLPSSDLGIQAYQSLMGLGFSTIALSNPENINTENNGTENNSNETPETPETPEIPINEISPENDLFSLKAAENLMAQAQQKIDQQDYEGAIEKLKQARQMLQQLSNLHLRLANAFQGINPDIYADQRQKAFETGQKGDESTYQMALIHRQQHQAALAIPLLIQVISSQSPSSDLGKLAYQQLYDLGFVDSAYR